ncbi:rRNA-processing protein SAS10 Ecym_8080 [Eremothecium cymbalariae DBVPG|uniref:Sas10 C-terminal domain-containing protein n=1 Tax=Eremothecium cymbalariae (strain CBS 270.75 / DBVPG 7215 / KCTC 17166 / NRRL Y-17582) TaxID=931890 RepID=G8JX01_ERECY|nr:Hypothetical protein Ecym_8080 [Eremothecium cymbalariae DBVPG\
MSRKKQGNNLGVEASYGVNEVDEFAAKREKVLFDKAGLTGKQSGIDTNSADFGFDEEEEIMDISDEYSDDSEELDADEAYKKVFGRRLEQDEDAEAAEQDDILDNEDAWGSTRSVYYGADDIEDEEDAKEIEKEALRQQKKHLEELNMDDYLGDDAEHDWVKEAKEFDMDQFEETNKQKSSNVAVSDVLNMDVEAKENFLRTSFPEFFPLSKEFEIQLEKLQLLKSEKPTEVGNIKIMALSSYLGAISVYFAIFFHELKNNESFSTMKDHPVMESILTTKEVWRQAHTLPEERFIIEDEHQESDNEVLDKELVEFECEELEDDLEPKVDSNAVESNEEDEDADNLFEIDVSKTRISKKHIKNPSEDDFDDHVESEIADVDAQEKRARKKTLRFYTSKIDQQETKKVDKFKGDDDIPYKERLFERQQRLLEEARKRGLHDKNGADLGNDEYNSEDEAVAKSINKESEDDYYSQVKKGKAAKKEARMQAHMGAVKAAREGKLAELAEELGDNGKRAINYQILKNKGLTPKRNKDNRNSRVKKRKKYEKAQKKLKSVRAVYSGGQSGVYGGEMTGIRKNLTKSVKFKG